MLAEDGLLKLAELYSRAQDAVLWTGAVSEINEEGTHLRTIKPHLPSRSELSTWWYQTKIAQPSTLFSTKALREVGGVNEAYRYAMDVELYCRLWRKGRFVSSDETVAKFRKREGQISQQNPFKREKEVISSYWKNGHKGGALGRLLPHRIARLGVEWLLGTPLPIPGSLAANECCKSYLTDLGCFQRCGNKTERFSLQRQSNH